MSKQITYYFIRHGKTEWNEQGLMQGWGDSPLIQVGIDGAKAVGDVLKDVDFNACFTSTSGRTQQTADYILANHSDVPRYAKPDLREMYFGIWDGMSSTAAKEYEEFHTMRDTPAKYRAQLSGGETYQQMLDRTMRVLKRIEETDVEGNVLIVSHGMVLRQLMYVLGGGDWREHRDKSENILNTSISIVDYKDDTYTVREVNKIDHLEGLGLD